MCLRDNETTLRKTFSLLDKIQQKHKDDILFKYCIYENDSKDDTKNIIREFASSHKCTFLVQTLNKKLWANVRKHDRVKDMVEYRNKMKSLCGIGPHIDYCVVLDSNICFEDTILEQMIDVMDSHPNAQMVTPFGHIEGHSKVYYDTFAIKLFDVESERKSVKALNRHFYNNDTLNVESAFGGFALIRAEAFKEASWKVSEEFLISEHYEFCKDIRKFGDILICKNILVSWKR